MTRLKVQNGFRTILDPARSKVQNSGPLGVEVLDLGKWPDGWIKHGHESVLEHFSFTVHFNVDRGVTHEQVRHRIASFSQESTRYCNYDNDQFGNEIKVIDIRGGMALDTKMKGMSVHLINEIFNEIVAQVKVVSLSKMQY